MIMEAGRPAMRPEVMRAEGGWGRWPGMVFFYETFEGLVSKALFQKSPLGSDLGKED